MAIRSLWRRIHHAIGERMRQRVTLAGFGFSMAISIVAVLAFVTANNLLFLLLACLLAGLLLSGFLSRLSLAGLELDFVFPEHVSARRDVPARMKLKNEKTWMPSFSIHVSGAPNSVYSSVLYFPLLPGGATVEETVDVHFARRGPHKENSFRLRSRFPFGFAERFVQVTLRREVLVYPCLDPRPQVLSLLQQLRGEMEAQVRGRGHDFYRIRPYEALESARHVDWKASAHTGELQVREFAREQEALIEIFLDLDVPAERYEWFEAAVEASACIAWDSASRGARVWFRTQVFSCEVPIEGDIYTILKFLALAEPVRSKTVLGPGRDDSIQVVLTASPTRLSAAGWSGAHMVGVDALPVGADAGPKSASSDRRKDRARR